MTEKEKVEVEVDLHEQVNIDEQIDIDEHVEAIEEDHHNSVPSELDQLRHIVFGSAKAELDVNLADLQLEMREGFEHAAKQLQQQMTEIKNTLQESVNTLEDRIAWVDNQHSEKSLELIHNADKLTAEVEMNDANNQQHNEELHKKIDNDIDQLTNTFTQQHERTIELLNQVKKDLNSSKTDRKTLARLLATVANDLDTDEER